MKNAPLVTVIIPTYNRAHLLSRAIRSVLCQTFQEWELIIVDDGSVDNTEEIVKGFSDPRVRYIRHQANRGESAARNTGIQMARGKYIAFLDSDDEWLPEKLEKQLKIFENSDDEVGVVYTGAVFIDDETGKQRIKKPRAKGWIFIEELAFNPVGSPSRVMVKRECFDKCGGFDEKMLLPDWDMWIRLAEQYKFDYVEDPLVRYFEHRGSVSAQADRLIAGYKRLWAKYGIERRERWIRALHYFRLGHRLCYYGAMRVGRQYLLKAVLVQPWQIKYGIAFLISLLGQRFYKEIAFTVARYMQ
jgi:glycosyltransferase involved in cell wall biosynthesis